MFWRACGAPILYTQQCSIVMACASGHNPPLLSWPANAGHPVLTCADGADSHSNLIKLIDFERDHLGGPHSRAMTDEGLWSAVADHDILSVVARGQP